MSDEDDKEQGAVVTGVTGDGCSKLWRGHTTVRVVTETADGKTVVTHTCATCGEFISRTEA